jgi:Terpene cyclase DEP1
MWRTNLSTYREKPMLKSPNVQAKSLFNSPKLLYLFFTIAGTIAPWFWLLQDPTALLSPTLFLQRAFENSVAAALTSDLLISAIAFFFFVWIELKRLDVSRSWIFVYVALTFGVGLSCALPFFLYRREQVLNQN